MTGVGYPTLPSWRVHRGTTGNDTIIGTEGRDAIYGDEGHDVIEGLGGDDLIYGDAGNDTVSYASSPAAVQVSLYPDTIQHGGDAEGDRLFSIENAIGSAFGDSITGSDQDNRLEGGGGRDMLYGRGGSDTLIGGLDGEADVIDGGADTDTVDYSAGRLGMTITLGNGPTKLGNGTPGSAVVDDHVEYFDVFGGRTLSMRRDGWQEDELYSIENVIGSQGNDTITGNGVGNRLEGGNGDDVIDGGGGADTIIGGRGVDELTGGPGADTFVFLDVSDSDGATGGVDFIWDFIPGEDKIDVSAIDADTTRSGNQGFTVVEDFTGHVGELTMFLFTNPDNTFIANRWIISGDVDGDGAWDFKFDMWPASFSDVTAADFIL